MKTNQEINMNNNIYVLTTKYVVYNDSFISLVLHDEEGDWQFLGNEDNLKEDDALVVSLEEILNHDPSLSAILDLAMGKQATRDSCDSVWIIQDIN